MPFVHDRYAFASLSLAILLTGCPPAEQKGSPSSSSASSAGPGGCSKVGQSCEFSPGKLGSCVQKDDCPSAAACFVCQSQH